MSILSLFKKTSFDESLREAKNCGGSLVDVRTPEEYAQGHIPGARNSPLDSLPRATLPAGKLFVYCHSGARSAQAVRFLTNQGRDAVNIGGIIQYHGPIERGL